MQLDHKPGDILETVRETAQSTLQFVLYPNQSSISVVQISFELFNNSTSVFRQSNSPER